MNKIFKIELGIEGAAGHYAENRQQKYQEFYIKNRSSMNLFLVSRFARSVGAEFCFLMLSINPVT
jgi:hypothetical protein